MSENAASILLKEKIENITQTLLTIQGDLEKDAETLSRQKTREIEVAKNGYLMAFQAFETYFEEAQNRYHDIALQIFAHSVANTKSLSRKYLEQVKDSPTINHMEFLTKYNSEYQTPKHLSDAENEQIEEEEQRQSVLKDQYQEYQTTLRNIERDYAKTEKIIEEKQSHLKIFKAELDSLEAQRIELLNAHEHKINEAEKNLEIFTVEVSMLKDLQISKKWIELRKNNNLNVQWRDSEFINSAACQGIVETFDTKIKAFHLKTEESILNENELFSLDLLPLHQHLEELQLKIFDIQEQIEIKIEELIEVETVTNHSMINNMPVDLEQNPLVSNQEGYDDNLNDNEDRSFNDSEQENSFSTSIQVKKNIEEESSFDEIIESPKALSREDIRNMLPSIAALKKQEFIELSLQVTQSFYKQVSFFWDNILQTSPIKKLTLATKKKYMEALHNSLQFLQKERENNSEHFLENPKFLRYNQAKRNACLKYLIKIAPELELANLHAQYPLHTTVKNPLTPFKEQLQNKKVSNAVRQWQSHSKAIIEEIKDSLNTHDKVTNIAFLTELFNLVINSGVSNRILCFNFFNKLSAVPEITRDNTGYLDAIIAAKATFTANATTLTKAKHVQKNRSIKETMLNALAERQPLTVELINPTNQPSFFSSWHMDKHSMNLRRTNADDRPTIGLKKIKMS
ncbi:MAG: hypothetical protein H2069_05320 [Legionella sp.]|nr:hypothetical protein [Legionella sp.]